MIEYYKTYLSLYKIIDSKVYLYDFKLKDWKYCAYSSKQYVFKWYDPIQLTLLDRVMLGIPE